VPHGVECAAQRARPWYDGPYGPTAAAPAGGAAGSDGRAGRGWRTGSRSRCTSHGRYGLGGEAELPVRRGASHRVKDPRRRLPVTPGGLDAQVEVHVEGRLVMRGGMPDVGFEIEARLIRGLGQRLLLPMADGALVMLVDPIGQVRQVPVVPIPVVLVAVVRFDIAHVQYRE
jgi:hypothetical protein